MTQGGVPNDRGLTDDCVLGELEAVGLVVWDGVDGVGVRNKGEEMRDGAILMEATGNGEGIGEAGWRVWTDVGWKTTRGFEEVEVGNKTGSMKVDEGAGGVTGGGGDTAEKAERRKAGRETGWRLAEEDGSGKGNGEGGEMSGIVVQHVMGRWGGPRGLQGMGGGWDQG